MKDTQAPLKIGYLWQYERADMDKNSATVLHIKGVIESLEQRGHEVRLVTYKDGRIQYSDDRQTWQPVSLPPPPRWRKLLVRSIRAIQGRLRLPFFRYFDSAHFAQACLSALAGYDVFYERYWLLGYGGLMAAKRAKVPLVSELNGDLFENYRQLGIELSRMQWAVNKWVTRRMFAGTHHLVAVSAPLRESMIERWGLEQGRITAVSNGARINLFSQPPTRPLALEIAQEVGDDYVVMFVGTFKPWHGTDLLLDAFGQVVQRQIPARLVLVGDGPLFDQLESQVRAMELQDRVIFTGKVPHEDVAALLQLAHVAVLSPGKSDSSVAFSPLKLFEYMAAGKAVVVPALPNIAEIVRDKETGWLVPPDDTASLAEAIAHLLQNDAEREELGQLAQQEAVAKFSWDNTTERLEAIMRGLLK